MLVTDPGFQPWTIWPQSFYSSLHYRTALLSLREAFMCATWDRAASLLKHSLVSSQWFCTTDLGIPKCDWLKPFAFVTLCGYNFWRSLVDYAYLMLCVYANEHITCMNLRILMMLPWKIWCLFSVRPTF